MPGRKILGPEAGRGELPERSPNQWAIWSTMKGEWWGPKKEMEIEERTLEELYLVNPTDGREKPHMKLYQRGGEYLMKLLKVPQQGKEILADYVNEEGPGEGEKQEESKRKRKEEGSAGRREGEMVERRREEMWRMKRERREGQQERKRTGREKRWSRTTERKEQEGRE